VRRRLQIDMRMPNEGADVWLLVVDEDGEYRLAGLTHPDAIAAAIPALREVVVREEEDGDTDGLLHLRREFLLTLERMA
jgi:hypothetical protein